MTRSVRACVQHVNGAVCHYLVTEDSADALSRYIEQNGVSSHETYRLRTPVLVEDGTQSTFYLTGIVSIGFTRFPRCEIGEDLDLGGRLIHQEHGSA